MTCERCDKGYRQHSPMDCGYKTCPDGQEHEITGTYQNYGYVTWTCSRCKRFWSVDSSG